MKKIWIAMILAGCIGLSACGKNELKQMENSSGDTAIETVSATDTEKISSLRDMDCVTVSLVLEGKKYEAVVANEVYWIDCRDLEQAFDMDWKLNANEMVLTDADGKQDTFSYRELQTGELPTESDETIIFTDQDGNLSEGWIALNSLTEKLPYRVMEDEYYQTLYISRRFDTSLIQRGIEVPVLMYHAVSDDTWGLEGLFMSPDAMRDQFKFLTENGYDPIFFSDLTHIEDYDKPVILTFDDGYNNNYSELFPLLKEYQVKATIFVITDIVDYNPNFMTRPQIAEMAESGLVSLQSHTASHQELGGQTSEQQAKEMEQSQLALTRMTGRIPYVLSYPSGSYNTDTVQIAPDFYDFAVKSRGNRWTIQDNFYEIDRYPVYRGISVNGLAEYIK